MTMANSEVCGKQSEVTIGMNVHEERSPKSAGKHRTGAFVLALKVISLPVALGVIIAIGEDHPNTSRVLAILTASSIAYLVLRGEMRGGPKQK